MPLTIPKILAASLLLLLLASCELEEGVPLRAPSGATPDAEIDWSATADSMQEAFYTTYLGANGTFVQDNRGTATFHYWPNAHALHVLVDGYERTGDPAYLPRMLELLRGIRTMHGGSYSNVFNDDMLWLGNASVRAYNATGNEEYREVAEFLWEDIIMSYSDIFGGGISWKKDTPYSKNAVSNGPAIVLAMRLYALDQDSTYLQWARDLYEWQNANLVDPATGLVWDNISEENGTVSVQKDWVFTYNQGTWIGAGNWLYEATGEEGYLNNSLRTARSLMTSPKVTTDGILRDEGQGDGGLFKGILVRYLTELILQPDINDSDRQKLVDFMQYNGETFYQDGLLRPEMLAGPNWARQPTDRTDLTTQLSGLMLVEAMAKLQAADLL
ncbi:glycoside hydrolase family 76 protein [Lewinella sp. IMCC34183]|uniref:glycoside hydrolase family 76 protein n=1 Tax=Lewinella sp. IMCC34183 TaxID=2248762 RepID=UPI000E25D914|nr:glycoside hydrolase family 76 protein [Lewinella sp. IMCC34183]